MFVSSVVTAILYMMNRSGSHQPSHSRHVSMLDFLDLYPKNVGLWLRHTVTAADPGCERSYWAGNLSIANPECLEAGFGKPALLGGLKTLYKEGSMGP